MTKDIYVRILNVTKTLIEQANAIQNPDLASIEQSRRWLASQKKKLDALATAREVFFPDSRVSRN